MKAIDQIKLAAAEYCRATGLATVTLSWRLFKDSKRLRSILDKDGDLQTRRFETAMQWFSDNWPEGAAWPAGVARPAAAAKAEQAA